MLKNAIKKGFLQLSEDKADPQYLEPQFPDMQDQDFIMFLEGLHMIYLKGLNVQVMQTRGFCLENQRYLMIND
eukprot:5916926-Ditylum_brightwellii.AAC.1